MLIRRIDVLINVKRECFKQKNKNVSAHGKQGSWLISLCVLKKLPKIPVLTSHTLLDLSAKIRQSVVVNDRVMSNLEKEFKRMLRGA